MAELKEGVCNKDLASLALKIVKMGKAIGKMEEDGRNTQSGYKYISSENVLSIVRNHLEEYKISIIPSVIDSQEISSLNHNQKQVIRTRADMEFMLIDLETGYSIIKKWSGADQDYGGKSFGQAITENVKRFYFKLFNVSSKDDVDPDNKTTEVKQKKGQPQTKPGGGQKKYSKNANGEYIMHIGKHKGKKFQDIPSAFFEWVLNQPDFEGSKDLIFKAMQKKIEGLGMKSSYVLETIQNVLHVGQYKELDSNGQIRLYKLLKDDKKAGNGIESVDDIDKDIPPEVSDVAQKTNEKKEVKK